MSPCRKLLWVSESQSSWHSQPHSTGHAASKSNPVISWSHHYFQLVASQNHQATFSFRPRSRCDFSPHPSSNSPSYPQVSRSKHFSQLRFNQVMHSRLINVNCALTQSQPSSLALQWSSAWAFNEWGLPPLQPYVPEHTWMPSHHAWTHPHPSYKRSGCELSLMNCSCSLSTDLFCRDC